MRKLTIDRKNWHRGKSSVVLLPREFRIGILSTCTGQKIEVRTMAAVINDKVHITEQDREQALMFLFARYGDIELEFVD